MVTRDILYHVYLTIDTLLEVVVKKKFPLLSVGLQVVMKMHFVLPLLVMYLLSDG